MLNERSSFFAAIGRRSSIQSASKFSTEKPEYSNLTASASSLL